MLSKKNKQVQVDTPNTVITAVPSKTEIFGLDEYMRRVDIPPELISKVEA